VDEQQVETTLYSLAEAVPPRPERRSTDRYLSLLRVGALTVGDRRELCLIRNVSAGGMMIRAYSAIAPGTRLSIELKQGEAVEGFAQWAQDGLTGVEFESPIDIFSLLSPPGDAPRPRMPRIEVHCTAFVRQGADTHRTRVTNISQGGICVICPADLEVDAEVIVTIPGLAPIPGVVKWRSEGAVGISFNRVLALSELMEWLKGREQFERKRAAG
jgi:hypothetical protein